MSAFRGATKVDFANGEDAPGAQPNPPLELLAFTDGAVPWLEDAWLVEDVLPNEGLHGLDAPLFYRCSEKTDTVK